MIDEDWDYHIGGLTLFSELSLPRGLLSRFFLLLQLFRPFLQLILRQRLATFCDTENHQGCAKDRDVMNTYGSATGGATVGSAGSAMVIGREMDDLEPLTRASNRFSGDGSVGAGLIPITDSRSESGGSE